MKVVLLTLFYPPYVGGVEVHTREVATALASAGQLVEVICFAATNQGGGDPSLSVEGGITVTRLRSGGPLAWIVMAKRIAALGTVIVHVQGYSRPLILLVRLLRRKGSWVLTPHGLENASRDDRERRTVRVLRRMADQLLMCWLLDGAAFIFAITPTEKAFAETHFSTAIAARTVMLGSPLPHEALMPTISQPGGSGRLLALTRVEKRKRLADLLDVLSADESLPGCDIVGPPGAESEALRSQAATLPTGRITMRGPVGGSEKVNLLRGALALVLCSDYEGLPIAALEALAQGTPVIASTGAARSLPQAGVLRYPTGNLSALSRAIRAVYDPRGRAQIRREAAQTGRSLMSVQSYANQLRDYYGQAIGRL